MDPILIFFCCISGLALVFGLFYAGKAFSEQRVHINRRPNDEDAYCKSPRNPLLTAEAHEDAHKLKVCDCYFNKKLP